MLGKELITWIKDNKMEEFEVVKLVDIDGTLHSVCPESFTPTDDEINIFFPRKSHYKAKFIGEKDFIVDDSKNNNIIIL